MNDSYIFYKDRDKTDIQMCAQFGWQENFEKGTVDSGYIMGYKEVADIIIENYSTQPIIDSYIFPVVFCYRQYLELVMKNLIYKNETEDDAIRKIKKCSHDLLKIWSACEEYSLFSDEVKKKILKIIKAFYDADSTSMNYRYIYDKKKKQQLTGELFINLQELKNSIDFVDDYFWESYN